MNVYRCARTPWIIFLAIAFAASIFPKPAAAQPVGHGLYTVPPCRLYDSRVAGSNPQGPLTPKVIYNFNYPAGKCGIPADAEAVVLNLAAVTDAPPPGTPVRSGYISVFPGGTSPPGFGVSFIEGQNRALFLLIKLGTSPAPLLSFQGIMSLPTYGLVIDITGYTKSDAATGIVLSGTTVPENQPSGTLVGNLTTIDPEGDAHTYTLVPGVGSTDNAKFQISGNQLRTAMSFDFETQSTFSIRVRSTDTDGQFIEAVFTITVTNVNEAPTDLSVSPASVAENQPAGTLVGTLSATDPDTGDTFTYALVPGPLGPDNAFFQISGNQLRTNAVFDRETKPTYTIYVQATDAGGLTFAKQITITIDDSNDPPAPSGGPFSVPENSPVGTVVGAVAANDPDSGQTHTFTIIGGNPGGAFTINPATGQISVANPAALNFETGPTITLTVQATDSGSPSQSGTVTVTINLTDVNEPPAPSGGPFSVPENSPAGTVVGTVTATDPDPGQTATYAIVGGNPGGAFAINPATGQITVVNPAALNFETSPTITLTVQATDNGSPAQSGTTTITINLTDVNEPPVPTGGPFSVPENSPAGTVVGTVAANDPDPGQTATYAIVGGNPGGAFAINPTTGQITVANPAALNFETNPTLTLTVQVTDSGSPGLSGTTTVTVNLTDVNEPPVVSGGPFTVPENSPAGTVVGTVTFTDPDVGQSGTFSIVGGSPPGAFAINPTTGAITVLNPALLDFETNPVITLVVQVTDNGSPAQTGTQTITINLANANDAPIVGGGPFTVPENTINGTNVGFAVFTDQDSGQTHTFAIISGNTGGAFTINPSTGLIRVANSAALNFETSPVFNLTVRVTDSGSPSMSGTAVLSIILSNVAEAPVANDEGSSLTPYVETVGNTLLEVTSAPSLSGPKIVFNGNFLINDSDPDGPSAFTVTLESATAGAVVTVHNDGTFTYVPPAGYIGVDSFTYQITDSTSLSDTATVYINVKGRVWYVKNNSAAGGLGRSTDPFDTLVEAETASSPTDTIYVFEGDGTTTGQSDGITLKSGQRLNGAAVALTVPSVTVNGTTNPTLQAAGNRPKIENDSTPDAPGEDNGVNVPATSGNATNVEIFGLDIAGFDNAIDVTVTGSKTASVIIRDNVISGAGLEGIDVNGLSTGAITLEIHDNTLTSNGAPISVLRTSGTVTIKAFDDNVITGITAGTGVDLSGATFDAVPGGAFDTVSFGAMAIGSPGDSVGQAGLVLSNVEGDISFTSLGIYAGGGAGLSASGFTPYTGSAGLRITVSGGTAIIAATGGPAVEISDAEIHLDLGTITSTNSTTTGVSLSSVTGSFVTGSGSSISNVTSSGGTAFRVDGSNATITYPGTISTTNGTGVSLSGNTGSTISFSGQLSLSTGANPAFNATGGGTVTATNTSSTLATTTATALNVVSTTIGAGGLRFRSISSNGGSSPGIVLNGTGTLGGLTVAGTGGSCTGAGSCTGGAIQNKTVDGISLTNARSASLSNLFLNGIGGNGISLAATGTSASQLTVTGSLFQNVGGSGLQADGDGTSQRTVTVAGSTFRDGTRGVRLQGSGSADLTFQVAGNTFLRHSQMPILVSTTSSSTNAMQVVGVISSNTIGDGTVDSGSASSYGIQADLGGDADSILSISGNTISHTELAGIYTQARLDADADAETGRLDLTLRNNNVQSLDAAGHGTRVESRNTTTLCLDIAGNTSVGAGGLEAFQTRQVDASSFLMERLSDGDGTPNELITSMPIVEGFLASQNALGSTADATQETAATGYTEAADASCRKPVI